MRIYTRTGDSGETSLIGGRVSKDDVRVEAYGTIDEANCFIGQAISQLRDERYEDIVNDLLKVQHEMFDCGADLANVSTRRPLKLREEAAVELEGKIDKLIEEAPKIEKFILPGGTEAASSLHIARTVTRRAERLIVKLAKENNNSIPPAIPPFINRLSDYFFALARVVNFRAGVSDVEYERSRDVFRIGKRKGQ